MEGVLGEGAIEVMCLTVHSKGGHLLFCKRTDCKYFKLCRPLKISITYSSLFSSLIKSTL